jgi:uncharacterized damage-inducible protein DinB
MDAAPATYRRWFEYERDSHAKTLASLSAVPEALRAAEAFQKAVDLLAHIVAARRLWLHRFGAAQEGPADLFQRNVPVTEITAPVAEMEAAWAAYLDGLTEAELNRVFEYQSYEGGWYRNTVADILTQLFGHSWYHRGQIALLLRSIGAEPAVTDFVFWTREKLAR